MKIFDAPFYKFIQENFEKGQFSNEDIVAIMTPIISEIIEIHDEGKVSSLDDFSTIYIENEHLYIQNKSQKPKYNTTLINTFFAEKSKVFDVIEEYSQTVNIGDETSNKFENELTIQEENKIKPIYEKDYTCYELKLNHHDPLTDIYLLGMIMASIAFRFDFTDEDDLKKFVNYRKSMVFLNPKINPSIAHIIYGMTEINRNKRWKDLHEIKEKLINFRDYNPESEYDLSELSNDKAKTKNQYIQEKLRNRLFDTSRRNRLLYYQPNLKFLNLTVSSIPHALNYQNIKEESIFYWNADISKKISDGNTISLTKYLQIEDNPYIIPSLDKIRLESTKDINEYGFSQLKLVVCFLNWYNTKENENEKIVSPLLLTSVNLIKKKGIKDQYSIEFISPEVEINPVLSNMLRELYGIKLPDTISLSEHKIDDIYELLKHQITQNNSGLMLKYIQKPQIKLIHTKAVQTLSQYNKRNRKKQAISDIRSIDYSYAQDNFRPYGLELFKNYIEHFNSSLEYLINNDIKLNQSNFKEEPKSIQREFYNIDVNNINPFEWEFDTCNLVLGNFNYKKMSLVRDFNSILEDKVENLVFDSLFNSLAQTKFKSEINASNTFTNNYNVVASDPTQNKAVKYSEHGENYIIQGPPGTGKSQTIANLIANYVANDKKVLFVCEKRAALDVVYYRLKNQGLDNLCCLIHDSQTDKKEFVQNLKTSFYEFSTSKSLKNEVEKKRQSAIEFIENQIASLNEFHSFMNYRSEDSQISMRELLEILISTDLTNAHKLLEELDDKVGYNDWLANQNLFTKLFELNRESNKSSIFCEHPFSSLNINSLTSINDSQEFKRKLDDTAQKLEFLSEKLEFIDIPLTNASFKTITDFIKIIYELIPFHEQKKMDLFNLNSDDFKKLIAEIDEKTKFEKELKSIETIFPHWKNKITETDAKSTLEILQKHEDSFFSFLNGSFRNAKSMIANHYDLNQHATKPKLSALIQNLVNQYEKQNQINRLKENYTQKYRCEEIETYKEKIEILSPKIEEKHIAFLESLNQKDIAEIKDLHTKMEELNSLLQSILNNYSSQSIQTMEASLKAILNKSNYIAAYNSTFQNLASINSSLLHILQTKSLKLEQLQSLLAEKSIQNYFSKNLSHRNFNMDFIQNCIRKIKNKYDELMMVNGNFIIEKQKSNFKELIKKSELSISGMSDKEKQDKRNLIEARKILENEFGKSIRFKSIRELATSESRELIRELKPVWLMSPLSVSDTLPINQDYFDVVIFDEASQITLEEGLPPIYRAKQVIIVGDEMQMPPSNFFGSSSSNQDDLWQENSVEDTEYFSLDADSFLTQGVRKFPSIMLGWHYRSRHESLISFSNASFYNNQLLTIPDVKDHQKNIHEIVIEDIVNVKDSLVYIHERPISYHYIKDGVYLSRSNEKEAMYIANLVRELIRENKNDSIGIVAFSMEQQFKIENAIEELCIEDKEFENALEIEYKRIENNQFVGLFIKNLENVQGDERDIIIMSTCYGYDPKGKMLMNFGPINKRGGEKRLNVLFSRAKKRMCVVSSIKYFDIKNEYNEGANYFRKYLQYAELVSLGQLEHANNVLNSISNQNSEQNSKDAIILQISNAIESKGFFVQLNIGQSKFKCHIAVKQNKEDDEFCTGVIIDDIEFYKNEDIMEQYILKPEILKSNGWRLCQIYSKDWIENRDRVIQYIISTIHQEEFFDIELAQENEPMIEEEEMNHNIENTTEQSEEKYERYINNSDGSNKFWEIYQDKNCLYIQFGRIGTKGQRMIKEFDNEEIASRTKSKLIAQKMEKNYFIA